MERSSALQASLFSDSSIEYNIGSGKCMVRRSFASRFLKLEETVCTNVSGLLLKRKLLATMKSAQGCPTKWVELERPHFHTGFSDRIASGKNVTERIAVVLRSPDNGIRFPLSFIGES